MNKKIFHRMIPRADDVHEPEVRDQYIYISSIIGIIVNLLLFIGKFAIGSIIGSISIISDGINNLSDTLSSVIAVVGIKLSALPPDKEHPQGHGRYEYIASLVVSILILFAGFELVKTSIQKLIHPTPLKINPILMIILALSILPKIYLYFMNQYVGETIDSTINMGLAQDSLNDCFATVAVMISSIVSNYSSFNIDAIAGIIVSFFIMKSGFSLAYETIDLLLGKNPEPELIPKIKEILLTGDYIIGVHDIVVNNYGRGNIICSAHVEVPKNIYAEEIHGIIDALEKEVYRKYKIILVLHMDPVYTLKDGFYGNEIL
ncbi:MAG: cation diffusion facilitator family transporter [Tissierellia bacterium]|nr:cation diffusion facilitator family transporter [Tissierellia bacterium]